jgi:CheY-like chemotaxis protein
MTPSRGFGEIIFYYAESCIHGGCIFDNMQQNGPIIILEDDQDDREILTEAFKSLGIKNELKFFDDCKKALSYLKTTTDRPFLIISDINMPKMSGNDLKREINKDEHLRRKSIPFIFFTTSAQKSSVATAYELMVQGYFQKANDFNDIRKSIKMIVDYWTICLHPNSD